MSNLSFRPRPIDVNRAIPIFTDADAEELDDRDYGSVSGLSRSVPQMPTGMEAEEEEEAHIQEAIKRSLNSMTAHLNVAVDIPTPSVKVVDGYDEAPNPKPFMKPIVYIIHQGADDEDFVDYDLETEDEEFLAQINAGGKKVLSESKFEFLMDSFEKESDKSGGAILPFAEMERLVTAKNGVLLPVYNHWVKRRQDTKHPLNIRYLKPPDSEDPDPYKAFRPRLEEKFKRKGRKNDQPSFIKMRKLRQEMERARLLLEMLKRREKLKREEVQLFAPIIELRLQELKLNIQNGVGEGAENDITPPTKRKKSTGPADLKRKRPVYEEPTYSDFDEEEDEEEEDEDEDDDEVEEGATGATSDAEYSPSEDEAELPPSPRSMKLGSTPASDTQAMEVTQQTEGDASRDPFEFLQGPGIGTFRMPGMPPFRGRARIGRGGRLIFDRRPVKPLDDNGGVICWESDNDYNPRTSSIAALVQSGYHPAVVGLTDADELLKQLQALNNNPKQKRKDSIVAS